MKPSLSVAAILALCLCACEKSGPTNVEIAGSLKALDEKLDAISKRIESVEAEAGATPKWAVADGNRIRSEISMWNSKKTSEQRVEFVVPPELADAYAIYTGLSRQLGRKRDALMREKRQELEKVLGGDSRRHGGYPMFDGHDLETDDPEYHKLVDEVEAARIPVESILNRKSPPSYESKYTKENLIREYAKGKFEIVVDVSFENRDQVYSADSERLDITQAVIDLFESKPDR